MIPFLTKESIDGFSIKYDEDIDRLYLVDTITTKKMTYGIYMFREFPSYITMRKIEPYVILLPETKNERKTSFRISLCRETFIDLYHPDCVIEYPDRLEMEEIAKKFSKIHMRLTNEYNHNIAEVFLKKRKLPLALVSHLFVRYRKMSYRNTYNHLFSVIRIR